MLSDTNASDFIGRLDVPIFRDPSTGRAAWKLMDSQAVKHDTFVFSRSGLRTLFWDARLRDLSKWESEIRTAVHDLGK